MIRREFEQTLTGKALLGIRIIWGGMMTTPLILSLVLYLQSGEMTGSEPALDPRLVALASYLLAGAVVVAVALLRRILLDPAQVVRFDPERASTMMDPPEGLPVQTPGSAAELRALMAVGLLSSRSMIIWAVCDGVAVVGFVRALLTGDPVSGYLFCAAGLLLVLLNPFPTGRLEEALGLIKRHPDPGAQAFWQEGHQ